MSEREGQATTPAFSPEQYKSSLPKSNAERDALIEGGIDLVNKIVRFARMKIPQHVDEAEIRGAALAGLQEAATNFDPARNAQFKTYASNIIRFRIQDFLRSLDTINRASRKFVKQREKAARAAAQVHGRNPTEEEIAEQMGIPLADYRTKSTAYNANSENVTFSIDDQVDDGAYGPSQHLDNLVHTKPDVEGEGTVAEKNKWKTETRLKEILDSSLLSDQERKILAMYFFDDKSMKEIGESFGVSESRISQISTVALKKVQAEMHKAGYKTSEKVFKAHNLKAKSAEV